MRHDTEGYGSWSPVCCSTLAVSVMDAVPIGVDRHRSDVRTGRAP
jgi:hypothetical protein